MIRNEAELKETQRRIDVLEKSLADYAASFRAAGLDEAEIEVAMGPMQLQLHQLRHDVQVYEDFKAGDFGLFRSLQSLGRLMIGARIFRGWTQRKLAQALSVDESLVSRDERNDYRGITLERARQILDALDMDVKVIITPKVSGSETAGVSAGWIEPATATAIKVEGPSLASVSTIHGVDRNWTPGWQLPEARTSGITFSNSTKSGRDGNGRRDYPTAA